LVGVFAVLILILGIVWLALVRDRDAVGQGFSFSQAGAQDPPAAVKDI
jgi:hypothetical protein